MAGVIMINPPPPPARRVSKTPPFVGVHLGSGLGVGGGGARVFAFSAVEAGGAFFSSGVAGKSWQDCRGSIGVSAGAVGGEDRG